MQLKDRVAIVTGAGGGLGRCHALYLAGQGAKVVVNDLTEAAAQGVADEIVTARKELRKAGLEAEVLEVRAHPRTDATYVVRLRRAAPDTGRS